MEKQTKKIADLREGDNVIVEADVLEVFDVKEIVKKDGSRISMQEVLIDDGSAGINLKLWGDKVNTLNPKQKLRVEGYVSEFKGSLGITTGKYGKIEILPTMR
jgi:ssDNA-binding replication factor A large subunit